MRNIRRRLKSIEERLNLKEEPKTITIVLLGGELPPDHTEGNMIYHFVMYDEMNDRKAKQ
jgi:hypothetical protein